MKDAIAYLNSLGLFRVKPGLERIAGLLDSFGNPQDSIPSIIVAGTNGKGSVAAGIASVLEAQGYRTGLYTSPHLVRITERIKINGNEISIDDFSRLILEIKKIASRMPEEPSYFEVITAAAFFHFSGRRVDFSVLEVGMGGRWDATNVVTPLVAVITNISRDHTEFLGSTIREIALEKAGVIKNGVPVITSAKGEALELIQSVANEKHSPIRVIGKDFNFEGESTKSFKYTGRSWCFDSLNFGLPGFYQLENACLTIAALETASQFHNVKIKQENLRKGLSCVKWEGRMETLRDAPPIILDGAHNPGAASALRKSLEIMFPNEKFVFLISMLQDKDHAGYFREIAEVADYAIITELPHERGAKAENLTKVAESFFNHVKIIEDIEEAFRLVTCLSTPVCITGSLYLVGEIKKIMSREG
ncbi:MAG TPA: folylpolyglutamate synthase/dihydrofolate synthase family protein [Thermodesulfobacteriota bacterium]|nr:folylpolyglutamate synthase/dihydrofolate synthase family protein [Thermodesulfobacteriota bacterium]